MTRTQFIQQAVLIQLSATVRRTETVGDGDMQRMLEVGKGLEPDLCSACVFGPVAGDVDGITLDDIEDLDQVELED